MRVSSAPVAAPNRKTPIASQESIIGNSIMRKPNLYLWKRDKSRGTNAKDYDAFDAKYKLFDSEHDKYKQQ